MRVLLAMDGSASSETARALVASLSWPQATCIRIVSVVEPMSAALSGLATDAVIERQERDATHALHGTLTDAAERTAAPGRAIEARLLRGRPASVIVEQARAIRADLIVIGSRGLGPLRSTLLGSVSAEVVDRAPCPVLVARRPSIGAALVAVDGSASAQRAADHLAAHTYLAGHRLHVLSVGPVSHAGLPSSTLVIGDAPAPPCRDVLAEDRWRIETHAARAAERLARDGYDVRWSIAAGDPAHEIIEAATDVGCDLIVMGSRGLTGLERVLLGSVARKVLLHSTASILVVREPVRERLPEHASEAAARAVLALVG